MSMKRPLVFALFLGMLLTASLQGQEMVKEPSTGKSFPAAVSIASNGVTYPLSLTGVTVRKKMIFKVYGMAHYIQDPVRGKKDAVLNAMTVDGKAKMIVMDFARDVDAGKIRDTYMEGLKDNASVQEWTSIQPAADQFVGFFTQDVKEGDQFVLRWLPGGIVSVAIAGIDKPVITNQQFARVLWSIWFGQNSIVDREDLVDRIVD